MFKLNVRALLIAIPLVFCAQSILAKPVTVTIMRVVMEQNSDTGVADAIDNRPDTVGIGDIYAKVRIGNAPFESTRSDFREQEDFQPFIKWTFNGDSGSSNTVPIQIQLWDADTLSDGDDRIDINDEDGVTDLDLSLDLNTCEWSGDVTFPANTSRGDGDRDDLNIGPFDTDRGGEIGRIQFDIACSDTNDFDGDGIPDGVERVGIRDIHNNGALVEDMAALGADPCRPNIMVEIDFMEGASDGHTHKPSDDALDLVRAAFDRSGPNLVPPLKGCPYAGFPKQSQGGIGLIIKVDDQLDEEPVTPLSDLPSFRNANFDPLLRPYFHYSLWVHEVPGLGGQCCSDKDFIIGLRDDPDKLVEDIPFQSIAFMHELGHALGLGHGGAERLDFDQNGDRVMRNCKPNYMSVMNYLFSTFGVVNDNTGEQILDFSRGELPDLREGNLDEVDGIGDGALVTAWAGPDGQLLPSNSATCAVQGRGDRPLDFDDDCDFLGAEVDLTSVNAISVCDFASPGDTLRGWNDWEHIQFRGAVAPGAADGINEVFEEQITSEETQRLQSFWKQYLRCGPPETGDWVISGDCTIWRDVVAPGDLIVNGDAVLKIPSGVTLDIDFANHSLRVAAGARVDIQPGGQLQ